MSLTRKHFQAIADIIAQETPSSEAASKESTEYAKRLMGLNIARDMAVFFKHENPAFDRERFLTACGF